MPRSKEQERTFLGERSFPPKGTWTIFPELCKGCGLCIEKCPTHVIHWSEKLSNYGTPRAEVDEDGCIVCGQCAMHCPDCAISVSRGRFLDTSTESDSAAAKK